MAQKYSYELFILFTSDLLDKQKTEERKSVKELIESLGGKVEYSEFWELRKLAYKIKGKNEGYYLLVYFDVDPSKLTTMEKEFLLNKAVLRHMVTKVKDGYRFIPTKVEMVEVKEREERTSDNRPRTFNKPMRSRIESAVDSSEKTEEKVEVQEKKEVKNAPVVEESKKKETKSKKKESLEEKMQNLDKKLEDIVNNPDIMGI